MTKEELKQYRSIIAELEEIRNQVNKNQVHDIVTGSDIEFPYIEHCMAVSGVPNQYIDTTGLRRMYLKG